MNRITIPLLLCVLFSPSILALGANVSVYPAGPTTADHIILNVTAFNCPSNEYTVSRVDDLIKIELSSSPLCDPPLPATASVRVGTLPKGTYRIEAYEKGTDGVRARGNFVVRDAAPLVEAHPSVVRTIARTIAPATVRLARTDGAWLCEKADCSSTHFRIGGTAIPDLEPQGDGSVVITPPERPEGLADIEIAEGGAPFMVVGALYYFDRPEPSIFERILFPVLDSVNGANGSRWESEATIANSNGWFVENWNYVQPVFCIDYPCFERLAPKTFDRFSGRNYPTGALLIASRSESDSLAFALRVRDVSRSTEGFGTEIPVVRERDMSRDRPIALLDVPRDPGYRVKVRLYAIDPYFGGESSEGLLPLTSLVTIIDLATGARSTETVRYSPRNVTMPSYAEINLPPGSVGQRSAIYVKPAFEAFTWAFAAVTNNATQQVTLVTPDGRGEIP